MAGFDNDVMYASNVDFSGAATVAATVTTNGQLLIGSTAAPNIRVGTLASAAGTITITPGAGTINLDLAGGSIAIDSINVDANTPPGTDPVVPDAAGLLTITGGQVAAGGVGANVIRTDSLAVNTFTIEIQRSTAVASTASLNNGVSHFDSADFTVDANGFVSLAGASGFVWNEITVVGPTSMVTNNGYVANNIALVTLTLPAAAAFGTVIRVAGKGTGRWSIAQNAGQSIIVNASTSTVGVGGSVAASATNDCVELLCTTANTTWTAISSMGVLVIT